MRKCLDVISSIDLLGYYPQLYIHQSVTHNTALGGTISIFVWLAIVYVLAFYIWESLIKRVGTVVIYEQIRNDIPIYNVSGDNNFQLIFGFVDNTYQAVKVNESIVEIKYVNYRYQYHALNNTVTNDTAITYPYKPCTTDSIRSLSGMPSKIVKNLDYLQCSTQGIHETDRIGGSFMYNDELFRPAIYVGPRCSSPGKCTDDELKRYETYTSTEATQLLLLANYYIPLPSDARQPKENVIEQTIYRLKDTVNKAYISIKQVNITSDNTYLPIIGATPEVDSFFNIGSINLVNPPVSHSFEGLTSEFHIIVTPVIQVIERSYAKVDSIVTRFFSLYLYMVYAGTIIRGMLHTYNLERYLINNTLINESSVKIQMNNNRGGGQNSGFIVRKQLETDPLEISFDLNKQGLRKTSQGLESINSEPDPTINSLGQNLINNQEIILNSDEGGAQDRESDVAMIRQGDSKVDRLKLLNQTVRKLKVKVSLSDRYSCSSLPDTFKKNLEYLYSVLDTRSIIKMYLQFEKMKQIMFNDQQKLVFELFSVDLSFLESPFYSKNLDDLNDEELKVVIDNLEAVHNDNDEVSKVLIKLLSPEFKRIIFQ